MAHIIPSLSTHKMTKTTEAKHPPFMRVYRLTILLAMGFITDCGALCPFGQSCPIATTGSSSVTSYRLQFGQASFSVVGYVCTPVPLKVLDAAGNGYNVPV